ncbi:hypothetical protein C8J57DRAFT_1556948 [Mycena rebaudengoi]|nr:hypothetical protein C8J57DRAFT_1556948 [Mycena rebaudengoi]
MPPARPSNSGPSHDANVDMPDAFAPAAAPCKAELDSASCRLFIAVLIRSTPSPPESQPLTPHNSLAKESIYWFWQLILITTAWLHLHFHTPHRACDLLLNVLRSIFICLKLVQREDKVPVTLTTTFKKLGLNEEFQIRAICPQ